MVIEKYGYFLNIIKDTIKSHNLDSVVDGASLTDDALKKVDECRMDILFIDLNLYFDFPADFFKQTRKAAPFCRIIILLMDETPFTFSKDILFNPEIDNYWNAGHLRANLAPFIIKEVIKSSFN